MKKGISILVSAIFAVVLSGNLFAQETAEKTNLKDSDVKSFVTNFKVITEEVDNLETDVEFDQSNIGSVNQVIEIFNSVKEIPVIFNKYGISGSNSAAKFVVILYGSMYFIMKAQLEAMPEYVEQAKAQGVDLYAQIEIIKSFINADDFKVIAKNEKFIVEGLSKEFQ